MRSRAREHGHNERDRFSDEDHRGCAPIYADRACAPLRSRRVAMIAGSKSCGATAFEDMDDLRQKVLPASIRKVLDDRAERQCREVLQQVKNDDHADQQADEQRSVGREGAGRGRDLLLGAE